MLLICNQLTSIMLLQPSSLASVSGGRKLKSHQDKSPAMMRGAFMRAVRQPDLLSHIRQLQTNDIPLFVLPLNELITLTFNFNFGGGQKDLLFGVQFQYDSGDDLVNS